MSGLSNIQPPTLPNAHRVRLVLAVVAGCSAILMCVTPLVDACDLSLLYYTLYEQAHSQGSSGVFPYRFYLAPFDVAVRAVWPFCFFGFIWFFARYFSRIPESSASSAE